MNINYEIMKYRLAQTINLNEFALFISTINFKQNYGYTDKLAAVLNNVLIQILQENRLDEFLNLLKQNNFKVEIEFLSLFIDKPEALMKVYLAYKDVRNVLKSDVFLRSLSYVKPNKIEKHLLFYRDFVLVNQIKYGNNDSELFYIYAKHPEEVSRVFDLHNPVNRDNFFKKASLSNIEGLTAVLMVNEKQYQEWLKDNVEIYVSNIKDDSFTEVKNSLDLLQNYFKETYQVWFNSYTQQMLKNLQQVDENNLGRVSKEIIATTWFLDVRCTDVQQWSSDINTNEWFDVIKKLLNSTDSSNHNLSMRLIKSLADTPVLDLVIKELLTEDSIVHSTERENVLIDFILKQLINKDLFNSDDKNITQFIKTYINNPYTDVLGLFNNKKTEQNHDLFHQIISLLSKDQLRYLLENKVQPYQSFSILTMNIPNIKVNNLYSIKDMFIILSAGISNDPWTLNNYQQFLNYFDISLTEPIEIPENNHENIMQHEVLWPLIFGKDEYEKLKGFISFYQENTGKGTIKALHEYMVIYIDDFYKRNTIINNVDLNLGNII